MNKCKQKRLLAGYTQKQAAKLIGRTATCISHYETGLYSLSVPIAKKMAEVYGCDWKEFYEEDGAAVDGQGHCGAI